MCVHFRSRTTCFTHSDNSVIQFSKMLNRISSKFITIVTKFYSPVFIQPTDKFTVLQYKYHVQTHILTRSCSVINPSKEVSEHYRKLYEEKLNSLLTDPKYKAMYDKYSLEVEYMRYMTNKVPRNLNAFNWLFLLQSRTKTERRTYIEFLWKMEIKEHNKKEKKILNMQERTKNNNNDDKDDTYTLNKCSMFHRIREKTMHEFYNNRLISAMLFEPILVVDIAFEKYMSPKERGACAKQLSYLFATNRVHKNPFNLYFCNVNKNDITMSILHRIIPPLYDPDFPINITSKCYLETFDKDKLVYLTPNSNKVLENYDANLIYIIGAIVDKGNSKPLTYLKAKKQGIQMMKLPLSEKLNWGAGSSKNLPLNHVLSIMLDLKCSRNWNVAFKHIPKRKLQQTDEKRTNLLKSTKMLERFYRDRISELTDKK